MNSFITFFMEKWAAIYAGFLILWALISVTWIYIALFSWDKQARSIFFRINAYVLVVVVLLIYLPFIGNPPGTASTTDNSSGPAFAVAGVIGTSIAIVFYFSTFILQSISDLFSTRYLIKFIEDKKERLVFWSLVALSGTAFSLPFLDPKYTLGGLMSIMFIAFCLIYELYLRSRARIDPEDTLMELNDDSIKDLKIAYKMMKEPAYEEQAFLKFPSQNKALILAISYKLNPNWHANVLENVDHLYEIGLRLLAKNEIKAFDLTVEHIRDIYLEHLRIRDGVFIRERGALFEGYVFEDEGFSTKIFEHLQSIGSRVIHENRQQNIYSLLKVYESIVNLASNIKYADEFREEQNPLIRLVLTYHEDFIERILKSEESDWVYKAIVSLSIVSNSTLEKTNDSGACDHINETLQKIIVHCVAKKEPAYLEKLLVIYFDRIRITWIKYGDDSYLWENLLEGFQENIESLSKIQKHSYFSIGLLFIKFHIWQRHYPSQIFALENEQERESCLSNFIPSLERWGEFLLDFSRNFGLHSPNIGLSIIQSINENLTSIHQIKNEFKGSSILKSSYRTQLDALSFYFNDMRKAERHLLHNLKYVLEILLREASSNLENDFYPFGDLTHRYILLTENLFKCLSKSDCGPIINLVYLGVLLNKYEGEEGIPRLIEEWNEEYLQSPRGSAYRKKNIPHLCRKIHNLKQDVFSPHADGLAKVVRDSVTEENWDNFVKKISYCCDYDFAGPSPRDIFNKKI